MSFREKLLSKLDIIEEKRSHITAICPVCGGNNLKVNNTNSHSHYNAYNCWTSGCTTKQIRDALDIPYNAIDPYKPSTIFTRKKVSSPKLKPTYYKDNFNGSCFLRCDLKENSSYPVKLGHYTNIKTVYSYSIHQRVVRLEQANKKKRIYIQYWNELSGWTAGNGEGYWPVYGLYDGIAYKNMEIADSAVFVEGEKCVDYLRSKGCAAFTFMSGCYNLSLSTTSLFSFKDHFPSIKNILYIPDCDSAGHRKEKVLRESFNSNGFKFKSLFLEKVFPDLQLDNTGKDVVDIPWSLLRSSILNQASKNYASIRRRD